MKVNIVTCAAWVPQGKAKSNPEKVEVSVDDLKRIIEETQDKLSHASLEDDAESQEEADNADDLPDEGNDTDQVKMEVDENNKDGNNEDIDKEYGLDTYDQEKAETDLTQVAALHRLTVFADPSQDPLLEQNCAAKDEDELSEAENHMIRPDDNLIAVGHVEEEAAILEVYVYNESGEALYVHHDNLLPAVPLCMEWLDYNPTDEDLKPGNLVAVGTMSPVIEVWDLDLIDGLEPAYKLGYAAKIKKSKKKKKKNGSESESKKEEKPYGHTDAVLTIAWNKEFDHVLASGSADSTVILWDLESQEVSQTIRCCSERVQCLQWHPSQSNGCTLLAAGSSAGGVHIIDCNDGSDRTWKVTGEVERVLWSKTGDLLMASTNTGEIHCIDPNKSKVLCSFTPHQQACTGLQWSSSCPGLLVTGSEDGSLRVWDALTLPGAAPTLVQELQPQVGRVHCLTASHDHPFVFCVGGDQSDNCFKVWDIRASKRVRQVFCPRLGLPVDDDEPDNIKLKAEAPEREAVEERFMGGGRRGGGGGRGRGPR